MEERRQANSGKKDWCILLISVIMAVILAVLAVGVARDYNNKITIEKKRATADLLLTPLSTAEDHVSVMFDSTYRTVYMSEEKLEDAIPQDKVENMTNQFYIQTVQDSSCCIISQPIRIVGIDQERDFVVYPWSYEGKQYNIEGNELISGYLNDLKVGDKKIIFGLTYIVGETLEATDTDMDSALYVDMKTAKEIAVSTSMNKLFDGKDVDSLISSCYVKLKDGVTYEQFMEEFPADELDIDVTLLNQARRNDIQDKEMLYTYVLGFAAAAIIICLLIALLEGIKIMKIKRESASLM